MPQTSLTFTPVDPNKVFSEADRFDINRYASASDDMNSAPKEILFSADGKTATVTYESKLTKEERDFVRQNLEKKLPLRFISETYKN